MIKLNNANSLTSLARKLAKDLTLTGDPFSQDWIVVQNKETQSWLQSELSRVNGVSANIKFIYPSELAWQIVRIVHPETPIELPTDRVAIESRVFDAILHKSEELSTRGLIVPDDHMLALNLSVSIGDVFDLYQAYRPELLKEWSNKTILGSGSIAWQSYLWKLVSTEIESEFSTIPARYQLDTAIGRILDISKDKLPNRINVFGLSHWSKTFFELMVQLSHHIEIHWYDQSLFNSDYQPESYTKWARPKLEVQQLFNSTNLNINTENLDPTNSVGIPNSISIHSCHNAEREVQVLKNEILNFLDDESSSTVDEILILVPDFERYGPIIENEFNPLCEYPNIPIFIPKMHKSLSFDFLTKMMDFFLNGEKVSAFIELIGHPIMRRKFNLNEHEIDFINRAFADMNIHHGLSINDSEFSIEKGVNQLLLSYSMSSEGYRVVQNFTLIDLISSSDAKDYITKIALIHRIFKGFKYELKKERTFIEWLEHFSSFLTDLLPDQDVLFRTIGKLINQLSYSKPVTKIAFEIFTSWIKEKIIEQSASSTRAGTGVIVSSYIPYRNIPFKFVAILGFNEGVFPRNKYRPDFDLIHQNPRPGDRIAKQDDSLLFYERLVSTEDHLHLSYIGEGERFMMPSSLIQELIEVNPDLTIHHHPLHGFSHKNEFNDIVYPSSETDIADLLLNSENNIESLFDGNIHLKNDDKISLNDFMLYFTHPSKHLLTSILGIKNVFENRLPEDRESFMLNGLDRYHLKSELVSFLNKSDDLNDFRTFGLSRGIIPRGPQGILQLNEEQTVVGSILKTLEIIRNQQSENHDLKLNINEFTIQGRISNIYDGTRVAWKVSKIKAKDTLELWINHLLLCHEYKEFKESIFIGLDEKSEIVKYSFNAVHNPIEIIASYISMIDEISAPKEHWSCIPSLASKYVEFNSDPEKQLKAVRDAWFSTDWSSKEDSDFYHQTIWKNDLPWENQFFKDYAHIIWEPILKYLKVSRV